MLGLLIIAIILGGIVAIVTGIGFLFWVVSIAIFICGLPFALINGFIQDKIDYAQDREDYRMLMHEISENERMDRYIDKLDELHDDYDDDIPDVFIDNRQVHYHNYYDNDNIERLVTNRKKGK